MQHSTHPTPHLERDDAQIVLEAIGPAGLWRHRLTIASLLGALAAALLVDATLLKLKPLAQVLVALVLLAPPLGHRALRTLRDQGPRLRELGAFWGRYALLSATWMGALALGTSLLGYDTTLQSWPMNPLSGSEWPRWATLVGGAAWILIAHHVSLFLCALCSGNGGGVLRLATWKLLFAQRAQLLGVTASALGVTLLAMGWLVPAGLLIAKGLSDVSVHAGVWTAVAAWTLPAALGLVAGSQLTGHRAAAAARASRHAPPQTVPASAIPLEPYPSAGGARRPLLGARQRSSRAMAIEGTLLAARPGFPGGEVMAFIRAFQALQTRADDDLEGAICEGERLASEHPGSAGVFAELAKLYRRADRPQDAVATASKAIQIALHGGMSPVAVETFVAFGELRQDLHLPAEAWELLARVLDARGSQDDARWCLARAHARQP